MRGLQQLDVLCSLLSDRVVLFEGSSFVFMKCTVRRDCKLDHRSNILWSSWESAFLMTASGLGYLILSQHPSTQTIRDGEKCTDGRMYLA